MRRFAISSLVVATLTSLVGCTADTPDEEVGQEASGIGEVTSTTRRSCALGNITRSETVTADGEQRVSGIVSSKSLNSGPLYFFMQTWGTFLGTSADAKALGNADLPYWSPLSNASAEEGEELAWRYSERLTGAFDTLCERRARGSLTDDEEAKIDAMEKSIAALPWYRQSCEVIQNKCAAKRASTPDADRSAPPATCKLELCAPTPESIKGAFRGKRRTPPKYVLAHVTGTCTLCSQTPTPPPPHAE
jgi:hypothetical protein